MSASIVATRTNWDTRYKRLSIGGRDMLADYEAGAPFTSIPIDTIRLTEEGTGGVSSLSFSIWDPAIEVTLTTGQDVEFWDVTNNRPYFLGFIASFSLRYAGPSRWVDIECVGIEVLLDWMLVPNLTIPQGTTISAAIQSCVYNATGVGWPIRAFAPAIGSEGAASNQATPTAQLALGFPYTTYDVTFDGDSLRNACATLIAACASWDTLAGGQVSIDFYSGLRLFPAYIDSRGIMNFFEPTDYIHLDINTSTTDSASTLDMDITSAEVVRAVYVKGASVAGSGLVSDGSGVVGSVAYLNDTTSDTAAKRNAIGSDYLAQFSQSIRGTLTIQNVNAGVLVDNVRVGSYVAFGVSSQVFNEIVNFTLYSISRTFRVGGQESWSVAFGGHVKSAAKQVRRLARATRS